AALSAGLAIVEQAGDLIESAIKRHFHVKDAGHLIPGHGGLLDRVDGLITTLLAVTFLTMAVGGSPLAWR
ncbi:MAG: phosphatidate cytidylyltransferase, partial [Pseudomonadota bacterium]